MFEILAVESTFCFLGFSDPYCKFKLGSQKYRSSVSYPNSCRTTASLFLSFSLSLSLSPLSLSLSLSLSLHLYLQVQHKTLNPEWKEHFEMKLYEGDTMLYVHVMDRDYLSSDDFIGR